MKISNTKEFGEEIRRRRKKLNYTQQFLSDYTGFSVSFISDLENAAAELKNIGFGGAYDMKERILQAGGYKNIV